MKKTTTFRRTLLWTVLLAALSSCCGPAVENPLPRLSKELAQYPDAVLILEDMRTTGNFVEGYEHRYKAVVGEKQPDTDDLAFREIDYGWTPVPKQLYEQYAPYLGMAVMAKADAGGMEEGFFPPVYHFAGNPRYGQWVQNDRGDTVWKFLAGYAALAATVHIAQDVFDTGYRSYRDKRRSRMPYFGRNNVYGTRGSYTQRTHRSFYERQSARQAAKQRSFSDRAASRTSRSRMSGTRSRSSSRGGK